MSAARRVRLHPTGLTPPLGSQHNGGEIKEKGIMLRSGLLVAPVGYTVQ